MANIDDYLDWRSDIPFSLDPFNEVDNLILSELVYTPFDEIIPSDSIKDKITIEEACERFFAKYSDEEILSKTTMTKYAPFLMRKMASSKRFGGMKLAGFVNELDSEKNIQFACISFFLPDNTVYVAFRGTDDTIVGWREDFDLCFSDGTGGQKKAVEYLNKNFARSMKSIRVGGHSKGGNFALYGAAFCKESVKDNIIKVYSNDGPGFINEIIESEEYKAIDDRIVSFIPQESIIGMLMFHGFDSTIIKSTDKGINQHDPLTWQVKGSQFIREEKLSPSSITFDEIIKKWVLDFDYESRQIFCDILFTSMAAGGQTKFSEVRNSKIKSVAQISLEIAKLDKKEQSLFIEVIAKLMSVSGNVFKSAIMEKIVTLIKSEKK